MQQSILLREPQADSRAKQPGPARAKTCRQPVHETRESAVMSRTGRIEGTGVAASTLEIPDISLDLVLKSAGLIERMGRERLKKR
jgi:hypothetical protein